MWVSELVSVLIVICTWHSRTPNADHPPIIRLYRSFSTVVWCPSFREKKIIMGIRMYVLYTCMYVLSFSTAECLQYTLLMSDYTHTYTRAYIHTSLTTHMYVCTLWMLINCTMYAYVPHIYTILYIYIYMNECVGYIPSKKCICMNALK